MQSIIQKHASDLHASLRDIRRHLHQHPELSFQEVNTAKYISEQLTQMGVNHQTDIAGHGIVAIIIGDKPSNRTVALRADIDALPILEANQVDYCSKNEGVMHACGHDVHTTSLLGAAAILQQMRHQFSGNVKLIFQPAEEKLPGGASLMIKAGVLNNPAPRQILGQHVHPPLRVGKVGFCPGPYMASADELYLSVLGKGGHGALPQHCVDPIVITSQLITAYQQLISRECSPFSPSVLSFGKINSVGGATNVIPTEVRLEGTFRAMDEKWRFHAHQRLLEITEGLAKALGGSAKLDIKVGYPVLNNDAELTARTRIAAVEYLGAEHVVDLPQRMTSEDFAFYSHEIPACFYRLGTGNPDKGITSPVHTDTFNVDEDCLPIGAGLLAFLALKELGN